MFYVYAHYKKSDNSMFYIGVAKSEKRFTSSKSRNNYWLNITKKHGFYYKILFKYEKFEECFIKEKELIKTYGRIDLGTGILCNMTDGGEGVLNLSLESRLKISNKLKNKPKSDEFKKNCSIRFLGKSLSQETKNKISKTHKKLDKSYLCGRKISKEHKENISKGKKGKSFGNGKILTEKHKKAISDAFNPIFNSFQIKDMIDMFLSSVSIRKIALKYNSNHNTISKYIKKNL